MPRVYFSLREANETVQQIKHTATRIIQLRDELELIDNTKIEFENDNMENYLLEVELNKNFHEKNLELYTMLGELIKMGCIIRDLDDFEIDFYSKFEKKDIAFCWVPGDDKIMHWHMIGENMSQRKPISDIEKKYFEELKKLR